MKMRLKRLWEAICRGFKASAESEHYEKTGRFLGEDPEFPGSYRSSVVPPAKKKVKIIATAAVAATMMVATAQAGGVFGLVDDRRDGDGEGSSFWGTIWGWITSTFTVSDVVQGLSTTYQAPPQALANNFAYGFDQASRDPSYVPVPPPFPGQTGQVGSHYPSGRVGGAGPNR